MKPPEFYRVCMCVCMSAYMYVYRYMYVFMAEYVCVQDYIRTLCYSKKILNWKPKDLVQTQFYQFKSCDLEDILLTSLSSSKL